MRSRIRVALLLLFALVPVSAMGFDGTLQADSTVVDRWRLPNGLDVVAHHVPGARFVSVTLAFRAGSGYDPADAPGLAQLIAHCWFFSGAGDGPERTREEMASLRPAGWDFRVDRQAVVFSEVTTLAGLAGVVAEFGRRLAHPSVSEAAVARAREATRRTASERYFGDPTQVMHYRVRALAEGVPDADLVRMADEKALAGIRLTGVTAQLGSRFVPANASLAIDGDLESVDVRALVATVFGPLPAGRRQPRLTAAVLTPGHRSSRAAGFPESACAIGLFAPSLEDSMHASFLLNMLLIGSALQQGWGPPTVGRTRFSYSLLDEPDLARVYPPLTPGGGPAQADEALDVRLAELGVLTVTGSDLTDSREHFRWLIGGPLSAPVLTRMRNEPGAILQLGVNEALRSVGRGSEFWERYLRRFDTIDRDQKTWLPWLLDRAHRATLVLQAGR